MRRHRGTHRARQRERRKVTLDQRAMDPLAPGSALFLIPLTTSTSTQLLKTGYGEVRRQTSPKLTLSPKISETTTI